MNSPPLSTGGDKVAQRKGRWRWKAVSAAAKERCCALKAEFDAVLSQVGDLEELITGDETVVLDYLLQMLVIAMDLDVGSYHKALVVGLDWLTPFHLKLMERRHPET